MSEALTKIRTESPFPWNQMIHPNGVVMLFDAAGQQVPLFHMTEFAVLVTHHMATTKESV